MTFVHLRKYKPFIVVRLTDLKYVCEKKHKFQILIKKIKTYDLPFFCDFIFQTKMKNKERVKNMK